MQYRRYYLHPYTTDSNRSNQQEKVEMLKDINNYTADGKSSKISYK